MKKGFSLVELSIVLVILGLLTGGILAGQSLIRASELRAVSTEYQRYVTAMAAFRDKYFATPGDMNTATKFWGVSTVCAGGSATGVCDGNNDGQIVWASAANATGESFQFWRHLASAGLVEGSYTGAAGAGGGADFRPGSNIPTSKLGNAAWGIFYSGPMNDANWYNLDFGTHFAFGSAITSSWNYGATLKVEEIWNIDAKLDDGIPGRGKIIVNSWTNCSLAANSSDYSAAYRLDNTTTRCILIIPKVI